MDPRTAANGATRVAAGLANAGVLPGDRGALHLGNSPQFAIALYRVLPAWGDRGAIELAFHSSLN